MADEPTKDTEKKETPEGGAGTGDAKFTQEEVNKIIAERLAREKSKFSELEQKAKELETLQAKIKEAEEAKLKEKAEWKELAEKHEAKIKELEPFKANWEAWQQAETERIEKMIEDAKLTDDDKALVTKLPLEDRRAMVERLTASNAERRHTPDGKGGGSPPQKISNQKDLDAAFKEFRKKSIV